jgi:hypothetical protein
MMIIYMPLSLNPLTAVTDENYEIKPHVLSLVQHNQFGGSAIEDTSMHLNTSLKYVI